MSCNNKDNPKFFAVDPHANALEHWKKCIVQTNERQMNCHFNSHQPISMHAHIYSMRGRERESMKGVLRKKYSVNSNEDWVCDRYAR